MNAPIVCSSKDWNELKGLTVNFNESISQRAVFNSTSYYKNRIVTLSLSFLTIFNNTLKLTTGLILFPSDNFLFQFLQYYIFAAKVISKEVVREGSKNFCRRSIKIVCYL